jgi:predicted PhzF superfamily epimerase YddE/YHI9
MRAVAAEVNLSETAFVLRRDDGAWDLRWFTPSGVEVDLCGHATLATAHVLGRTSTFHTRSGELVGGVDPDGTVVLDLPADPVEPTTVDGLASALGVEPVAVYAARSGFTVAELADAGDVRKLEPVLVQVAVLAPDVLVVTAPADRDEVDCVSRVFGPSKGIDEDPVTGSAHCTLAGLWGDRLGKDELVGEQASPRGGTVRMRRKGDRVELRGRAVTVATMSMGAELPT